MRKKQVFVFAIVAMALTGMNLKTALNTYGVRNAGLTSIAAVSGETGGEIGSDGEIGGESGGLIDDIVKHCIAGGLGSSECSLKAGADVVGSSGSIECSTTCFSGYYACCGLSGCNCIPLS